MKNLFENIEKVYYSNYILLFNKKINLKERFFFNHLLLESKKRNKTVLEINKSFFQDQLQEENIERFLKLFFEKKIIIKDSNNKLFGIINLISCFLVKENNYIFLISDTLYKYLTTDDNVIIKYQLELLLRVDNITIKNLFFYLLINLKKNNKIILTKKDLKTVLSLNKEYSRFFDLESKFILPTLKLIKEICDIDIEYIKIKGASASNSKITSLEFKIFTPNLFEENEKILTLLKNYNLSENTKFFTLQMIINKSFQYVLDNVYYFIDHSTIDYDNYLVECLTHNFANTFFNSLLEAKLSISTILFNCNCVFASIKDFEKKLKEIILKNSSEEIKEIVMLHTTFKEIISESYDKMTQNKMNNFLYDHNELLHQFENIYFNKRFSYEDKNFIFLAEFNTFKESYIYILKKENIVKDILK